MKKILLILLIAFGITVHASAQGHIAWSTREATTNMQANLHKGAATDRFGNTYTINFTQSNIDFFVTYRFFCYDANGVKKWQYDNTSCFTDCNDKYYAVVPVDNAGAIFIGVYEDLTGVMQVRIKRIGLNGQLLWQQYWISPFLATDIAGAALDHSGKLVVAFNNAYISSQQQENFAVAKFDTANNGANVWHLELPDGSLTSLPLSETFTGMAIDANDNIFLSGTAYDPFSTATPKNYFFKVNSSGSVDYKLLTNGVSFTRPSNIHLDPAGNIYLLGMNNAGTGVAVEQRVAVNGTFSWNTVLTRDSAIIDPVGFETIGGETFVLFNHHYFIPDSSFPGGHNTNLHYSIARLAYNGVQRWTKDYFEQFDAQATQSGQGGAAQILSCNNNLYVLSGLPLNDSANFLLLQKLDTAGNTVWYDSTREDFGIGSMAADDGCNIYVNRSARLSHATVGNLLQKFSNFSAGIGVIAKDDEIIVYPNPVRDEVHVSLPENFNIQNAVATLSDNLGRTVGLQQLQSRNTTISMQNLAAGVYYLTVTTNGRRAGVKMLVKQ